MIGFVWVTMDRLNVVQDVTNSSRGKPMCNPNHPQPYGYVDRQRNTVRTKSYAAEARREERLERVKKGREKQKRIYMLKYILWLSIKFINKYWLWFLIIFLFLQLIPDNQTELNTWEN